MSYEQQNLMSEIALLSNLTLARNHIIADTLLSLAPLMGRTKH